MSDVNVTAGILVIGDEVLKGQVRDTNSHSLCKRLRACGISVRKIVVVADDVSEIAEEVLRFSRQYNFVFTSGGIGPTHDDVTYEGLAKAFNEPLVLNRDLVNIVLQFYPGSERSVKENPALKIAHIPKSSELIYLNSNKSLKISDNFVSIMPVVRVSNVAILPGIPEYFEYIVNNIKPLLNASCKRVFHTLHLYLNQDEVFVIPALNTAVEKFKGVVVFGSYPVLGHKLYATRITLESVSKQAVHDASLYLESVMPEGSVVKWNSDPRSSAVDDIQSICRSSPCVNLSQRVSESIKVIEDCCERYDLSEVFLSFNGGKDCTVLLHLVSAVFQKKYARSRDQRVKTVYIQCSNPFPEVESFIAESAKRYNLDLVYISSSIKVALEKLLHKNPNLKAVLMGTRRTDPYSESLDHFQMTDESWPHLMRVSPILDWSYRDVWEFLKELFIPYCSLYDQGYRQMLPLVQAMEDTLLVAFGPHGRAALIREPTGLFTITRTGLEILQACYSSPCPVSCVLLNSAHELYKLCGDGVKSLFIEVSALLHRCVDIGRPSHTATQLMLLQRRLSEVCSCATKDTSAVLCDLGTVAEVIVSFLVCRLPESVACSLASLLSEWVQTLPSIKLALRDFNLLCLHQYLGSGPVSSSRVQQGFCISQGAQNFLGPGLYDVRLLLLGDGHASSGKFDNLDIHCEVNKLVQELESCKGLEMPDIAGTLLITPSVLPDLAVFTLRRHNVSIVQGVVEEELDLISGSLLRSGQSKVLHVRLEILGLKECTWLDLPGVSQLLLYAPTRGLVQEYARVSCDSLKLLSLLEGCSVVAASGKFEAVLLAHLQRRFKVQPLQLATGCIVGRVRLLAWHKQLNRTSPVPEQNGRLSEMCEVITQAFESVDGEVVEAVGHALVSVVQKLPVTDAGIGKEPVTLRLTILQHALVVCARLLKADSIVAVHANKRTYDS